MKRCSIFPLVLAALFLASSCTPAPLPEGTEDIENKEETTGGSEEDRKDEGNTEGDETNNKDNNPEESMTITISIGEASFKADIEDTETGKAFIAKLPLTLEMDELNGNEKYCYGVSLPRADKRYDRIAAGDLMLYSGNCVVLFYGSAGGYSYTRIGRLQSTDGLAAAVGRGSVSVRFEK